MKSLDMPKWLGRSILSEDDTNDLERRAAIHEFDKKMPRQKAEEAAYVDYMTDRRREAAAHHLRGLKVAQAAGDMEAARRHSVMYGLHLKALGGNPYDAPPPEVTRMAEQGQAKHYKFKASPGDYYAVTEHHPVVLEPVQKAMEDVQAGLAMPDPRDATPSGENLRQQAARTKIANMGRRAFAADPGVAPPATQPRLKVPKVRMDWGSDTDYDSANALGTLPKPQPTAHPDPVGARIAGLETEEGRGHVAPAEHDPTRSRFANLELSQPSWLKKCDCPALPFTHHEYGKCRDLKAKDAEVKKAEKSSVRKGNVCRCGSYVFPHRRGSHPSKKCP